MSYSNAGLRCLVPAVGDSPSIWVYTSADAHGDVDASDYFSDGVAHGMKAEDIVFVIDTATPTLTIHTVLSVDADGNATIGSTGT